MIYVATLERHRDLKEFCQKLEVFKRSSWFMEATVFYAFYVAAKFNNY